MRIYTAFLKCLVPVVLLGACSSLNIGVDGEAKLTHVGATRTPLPPVPMLPTVAGYDEGLMEIPAGKNLFVEYWDTYTTESPTRDCPDVAVGGDAFYRYRNGVLDTGQMDLGRGSRDLKGLPLGFFGHVDSDQDETYGGTDERRIYSIEKLPYQPPIHKEITLHSVNSDGTIVAEIGGGIYQIEPGQSWIQRSEKDITPDCHAIRTLRLTNHGLLDSSQIETQVQDDWEHLRRAGARTPNHFAWLGNRDMLVLVSDGGLVFYEASTLIASPLVEIGRLDTSNQILSVAANPDGTLVAFGDEDGIIRLYDVSMEQFVGEPLMEPVGPWISLAFSPDGQSLASGSFDGIIQLWDVGTQAALNQPLTDQMETVLDLEFSPDGRLLISASQLNSPARIWDLSTAEPHRWDGNCEPLAISPDGSQLACFYFSSGNDVVDVSSIKSQEVLHTMKDTVRPIGLSFSPDGTLLASGSFEGRVQLWYANTGDVLGQWTLGNGDHFNEVTTVAFNSNGTKLAAYMKTGDADWTIWLLNLETDQTTLIEGNW